MSDSVKTDPEIIAFSIDIVPKLGKHSRRIIIRYDDGSEAEVGTSPTDLSGFMGSLLRLSPGKLPVQFNLMRKSDFRSEVRAKAEHAPPAAVAGAMAEAKTIKAYSIQEVSAEEMDAEIAPKKRPKKKGLPKK